MSKMPRISEVSPSITDPDPELSACMVCPQSGLPYHAHWCYRKLLFSVLFVLIMFSSSLRAQDFNPNGFDAAKTMQEILNPHDDLVIVSSHREITRSSTVYTRVFQRTRFRR